VILEGSTEIPDNTLSNLSEEIGRPANLTTVVIPNTITRIGSYAFQSASRLTSITIPESVTTVDIGAFRASGHTSIRLPESVTQLGERASPKQPCRIRSQAFRRLCSPTRS
jgi:hypothetical protein